jgi:hypothetical protein
LILAGLASAAIVLAVAWFAVDWIRERQATRLTNAYVQEIISLLDLRATPDFHQRLDKIRTFINDNSVHKMDKAFWDNHGDAASFAAGVLAHAKRTATEPIHMECSTRSNLMVLVLHALGYETRIVAIFNSRTNLQSHSFLEVMNPETGRWETQDPDQDIYWRGKDSAERISLADAAQSIEDIEPCGRSACGWDHASREGIKAERLRPYLDIISITDKRRGIRYALYTSRADLAWSYSKGRKRGAFCEVEAKRCLQGFYDIRKYSSYAAGLPR